jgi:hypothetical protein
MKIGNNNIAEARIGSQAINKVMIGSTLVWDRFTALLDQLSTPSSAAYSLRKLRTAYLGAAINVRRSSDGATQDIGFATAAQTRTNLAAIPINNNGGAGGAGVTMTTVGTGTEFGQPYVEVRWQGTATSIVELRCSHGPQGTFNPTTMAPVTPGLAHAVSLGFRLVAGTFPPGSPAILAVNFNATGGVTSVGELGVPAATAGLQRFAVNFTPPAGSAYVQPRWRIGAVPSGTVVDFTMRFYAANVEQAIGNARPLLQRNVPEAIAAIGELDAEALLAFVGTGNGFVTMWYDQSGNGRNATQTTLVNQPQIVASGAVITMNGRPVVSFDGNDILNTPSFMLGNTVVTVARRSSRFEPVVEGANVGSNDRGLWGLRASTTDFTTHLNYGINGSPLNATNADGFPMNVLQIVSQTVAKGQVATNASIWGIGGGSNGYVRLNGFISEMVAISSLLSTTERQTIESNQGQFYGI